MAMSKLFGHRAVGCDQAWKTSSTRTPANSLSITRDGNLIYMKFFGLWRGQFWILIFSRNFAVMTCLEWDFNCRNSNPVPNKPPMQNGPMEGGKPFLAVPLEKKEKGSLNMVSVCTLRSICKAQLEVQEHVHLLHTPMCSYWPSTIF